MYLKLDSRSVRFKTIVNLRQFGSIFVYDCFGAQSQQTTLKVQWQQSIKAFQVDYQKKLVKIGKVFSVENINNYYVLRQIRIICVHSVARKQCVKTEVEVELNAFSCISETWFVALVLYILIFIIIYQQCLCCRIEVTFRLTLECNYSSQF